MPCLITAGFPVQCSDNVGGVYEVYIGTWNGTTTTYTAGSGTSSSLISAFTFGTVSFYTFTQEQQTASFKEEGAFSPENGTSFYNQTVEIHIQKMTTTNKVTIDTLGQGRWRIIVKDGNDNYWYVGAKDGMKVSAMASGTGKAKGDMNGAIITFSGAEKYEAYQLSTAAAIQVITP